MSIVSFVGPSFLQSMPKDIVPRMNLSGYALVVTGISGKNFNGQFWKNRKKSKRLWICRKAAG